MNPPTQQLLDHLSSILSPYEPIWLKLGNEKFFYGSLTEDRNLKLHPTYGSKKNRKIDYSITYSAEWLVEQSYKEDGGLFYLPGKPREFPMTGFSQGSNDIGVELDWGTREDQEEQYRWFEFVTGLNGLMLTSGNKSIHGHIISNEIIAIEQRTYLARLLCLAMIGDYHVINEHQPMRLAGGFRREKGRYQELIKVGTIHSLDEIVEGLQKAFKALDYQFPETISDARFLLLKRILNGEHSKESIQKEIRENLAKTEEELFPKYTPQSRPQYETKGSTREYLNYNSSAIPDLEIFLSKNNQDNLNRGGLHHYEDYTELIALIKDVQGCINYCDNNGISYTGDLESIIWGAVDPSNNNSRKISQYLRSANSSCTPAIGEDGLKNRLHWFRFNNDPDYKAQAKAEYKKQLSTSSISQERTTNREIEEIDDERTYQAYIEWGQEQEKIDEAVSLWGEEPETEETLTAKALTFIEDLKAKALNLSRKWFKGFGTTKRDLSSLFVELPEKIEYDPALPFPTPIEYEGRPAPVFIINHKKYSAEQFIYSAIKAGWTNLNDKSPTGSGKSFSVGQMLPELKNCTHWYIDVNHNNPSTQPIEDNYYNLAARHNGLTRGSDGKLKRSYSSDDKIEVTSNCHLADIFNDLSDKNIDYHIKEDKAPNPVCATCRYHQEKVTLPDGQIAAKCATSEGDGYGYRKQRREALERRAIRADIRSLPGASDLDYSNDLMFIEEGTQSLDFTKEVTAGLRDFDGIFGDLEGSLPEVYETLKPLRLALRPYLTGEKTPPRHGLDTQAIFDLLGVAPATLTADIKELKKLVQDLAFEKRPSLTLSAEDKQLKKTDPKAYETKKRLNAMARSFDNADYFKAFLEKLETLYSNFLIPLLKVWDGDKGAIRLAWKELKITYANERTIETLKGAKARIYLDATPNLTQIALGLGVEENNILRFSRKVETPKNLTIKPIHISGIGSRDWGKPALERVAAIKKELNNLHPELVEIGYKAFVEQLDLDGWWGNHNRGTNEFIGKTAMAFYGLPTPNLGQVQDEYLALKGNLEGFETYYESLVQTEIIQALGRSRASLDPDNQYVIYLVGQWEKFDLSFLTAAGFNVELPKSGFEITPDAGDKVQVKQHLLIEQLLQAIEGGRDIAKLSQTDLAHLTGIPQQTLSRLVSHFKGGVAGLKNLLISLYTSLNRRMGKISVSSLIQQSQELKGWLKLIPAIVTEEVLGLAAELENTEESKKLAKITDFILGHPQPLLVLGHLLGLIEEEVPIYSMKYYPTWLPSQAYK